MSNFYCFFSIIPSQATNSLHHSYNWHRCTWWCFWLKEFCICLWFFKRTALSLKVSFCTRGYLGRSWISFWVLRVGGLNFLQTPNQLPTPHLHIYQSSFLLKLPDFQLVVERPLNWSQNDRGNGFLSFGSTQWLCVKTLSLILWVVSIEPNSQVS